MRAPAAPENLAAPAVGGWPRADIGRICVCVVAASASATDLARRIAGREGKHGTETMVRGGSCCVDGRPNDHVGGPPES